MSDRKPIPAAFWWGSVTNTFDKILREELKRAKAADLRDCGHDCGHEWTISVTSREHSGIANEGPESHADSRLSPDPHRPVVVRAHNLRDALLLAAALPFGSWFEEEPDPATCARSHCDRDVNPDIDPDLCPPCREQADNVPSGGQQ